MSGPLEWIKNHSKIHTWTGSLPGRGRAINILDFSNFQTKLVVNQDTYLAGFTLLSGFKIARRSEGNGQKGSKDGNEAHIEQEFDWDIVFDGLKFDWWLRDDEDDEERIFPPLYTIMSLRLRLKQEKASAV